MVYWQKITCILCPWTGQAVDVLLVVDAFLQKRHIVGINCSYYVPHITFVACAVVGFVRGTHFFNFNLDNFSRWIPLAQLKYYRLL